READPAPSLTLGEVEQCLVEIARIEGPHSRRRKFVRLRELFARASALEAKYLAKILIREMRHGMSEGLMLEALARMAGRPVSEIRRAHMLDTDLGRIVRQFHPRSGAEPALDALSAATDETLQSASTPTVSQPDVLASARLSAPKPIRPMLA